MLRLLLFSFLQFQFCFAQTPAPMDLFNKNVVLLAKSLKENSKNFYFSNVMPDGPFKGEPLDVSERRPVIPIYEDKEQWIVANFYHLNKFYYAAIPTNGVEMVYLQLVKFLPIAAHSMLRFKLKSGQKITLLAELPTEDEFNSGKKTVPLKEPLMLDDVILSIESTWPVGRDGYSLLRGVQNHFVNTYRFVSVDTIAHTFYEGGKVPTEQYEMSFSPAEASQLLRGGLTNSVGYGQTKMYNTINQNCTTLMFDTIELHLPNKSQQTRNSWKYTLYEWLNRYVGFVHFYPILSKYAAVWANYSQEVKRVVNLEEEPNYLSTFQREKDAFDPKKNKSENSIL